MQAAHLSLEHARKPFRFFFSYSWKNRGRPLQRFFQDLAAEVRKHVGGSIEDVAFRDRVTMEAGTDWPQGLLEALKASQVLVFLVSTDYIQSDYCGKEFQVFLERIEKLKAQNSKLPLPLSIQPVIWVPVLTATMPKSLSRIQPEDEAFPREYAERGLESLAKRRDKTAYNEIVEKLAIRIVAAANGDRLPALDRYDSLDAIANAFQPDEPLGREADASPVERKTGVRCVYVAPKQADVNELKQRQVTANGTVRPLRTNPSCYSQVDGWHWQPFHPPVPVEIGSLVQQLVTDLPYREVLLEDEDQPERSVDEIIRKLETAANNDQIILLVVDAWSGYLKRYEEFLKKFDHAVPINSAAVLVPWNEGDTDAIELREELERQLRVLFKNKYLGNQPGPFFKPRVTSIEEFRNTVPTVLEMIRIGIETYRAAQRQIIESTRSTPQVRSARDLPNG